MLVFNTNSGLKFRKFDEFNGEVHSGCTKPTQASGPNTNITKAKTQIGQLSASFIGFGVVGQS